MLEAMEVPSELMDGAVRVSFGFENTEADVDAFLQGLSQAGHQLTKNQ